MGIPFHETVYGHRFFDVQLPKLTKAIDRLAAAMEQNNQLLALNQIAEACQEAESMLVCCKMMRDGDGIYIPFGDVKRCFAPRAALVWVDQTLADYKERGLWATPGAEMQFLESVAKKTPCQLTLYHKGDISDDETIVLNVKTI